MNIFHNVVPLQIHLEHKQSIPFSDEWRKAITDYDGL